jgi:hypothetical protein
MGEGNAPHLFGRVSMCATESTTALETGCAGAEELSVDGGELTSSSCPSRTAASLKSAIGGRTEPETANGGQMQKARYSGSACLELGCFVELFHRHFSMSEVGALGPAVASRT